ncbi:CHAD domain-containing protein [Sphingobium sp. HBC34]|uniref:CHAD domain-containing protein n=1 Tax=Sphingobium cyanobacteriorum TaxID=3063954 RepID=A0ABT8ZNN4_9SPHN|nr:CYTH and CHAD domain-containing protein [Sphingobium sp. HBC34]MDO7836120.1 CHAD domain-containing protein [Sphingobium sp. HBC34]
MQPEIELKLDILPEWTDALLEWPGLPPDNRVESLHATYFDTPDRLLAARGFSLRIRRSGRRRVQTVKASGKGGAGLFARDEWDMPVRGNVPVLDDRNPIAALLGDAVTAIAPIFTVEVERRIWLVNEGDATIELVLDIGMIHAEGRKDPVCEIELELKAGDPSALFALARRIDSDIPVRPGVLTKSERGYRLRDALPGAFKAEPVMCDPATDIGSAFVQVMAACLRQYRLNEALLLRHYRGEALHQARVAVRRLRSALTLFKPVLGKADRMRFRGELRWLGHLLGEARDLDVLLEQRAPGDPHRVTLEQAQADAHARVLDWLGSARVRMLMIDLVEWLASGPVRRKAGAAAAHLAARRLRRYRRRIAKRGRRLDRLTDEARHAVRKDAKTLRYGAAFFGSLFDRKRQRRRRKTFVAALERMQAELGALNDLVSAPRTLARYGLVDAPSPVERDALLAAAAKAQADFADCKGFWSDCKGF